MTTLQSGPYTIKSGDLDPPLTAYLQGAQKRPVDLTAATEVHFVMRARGASQPTVDALGTFVDRANGVVSYSWAAGDTDTPGVYDAEWRVVWVDGRPQRMPNDSYLQVVILGDLS